MHGDWSRFAPPGYRPGVSPSCLSKPPEPAPIRLHPVSFPPKPQLQLPSSEPKETIVAPAILWGRGIFTVDGSTAYWQLERELKMAGANDLDVKWSPWGFITSRGRFVARTVAWQLAIDSGQYKQKPFCKSNTLFPSDLWPCHYENLDGY